MKRSPKNRSATGMPAARVTVHDIADACDCSPATVSRALRDDPRITEEVRTKVKREAKRRGYTPNAIARRLLGGGPLVLAVVIPRTAEYSVFSQLHTATLRGVGQAVSKADALILLSVREERDYVHLFQSGLCSGVIVLMNRMDDPRVKALARARVPTVLIPGDPELKLPGINLDNVRGAEEIVRHLVQLGHRKFGLVGGAPDSVLHRERLEGIRAALSTVPRNQTSLATVETNFTEQSGELACRELLAQHPEITAVICINQLVATGALKSIAGMKLRVPEYLTVVSLGSLPDANPGSVPLTRVITDLELVGVRAAETLIAMVRDHAAPPPVQRLPVRIELGQSVAGPRTSR